MFIVSETSRYRRRRERNFEKMFVFRHELKLQLRLIYTPKTLFVCRLCHPSISAFLRTADQKPRASSPPSGRPASIEHAGSYRAPPVHRCVAAAFSPRNRRDGNSVSGGSAEQMRPGLEKATLPATCCVECGVMIRTDAASIWVV